MAHIEDGPEGCKCKSASYTAAVTSVGSWAPGGYFSPDYSLTSGSYATKCGNCGYCSCCGRSDIKGRLSPAGSPES